MFEVIFVPSPQHAEKIRTLSKEKKELIHTVLFDLVADVFSPQARGYQSGFDQNGVVKITANGISPFSDRAREEFTQKISNGLSESGLSELFHIGQVSQKLEPMDVVLAPNEMCRSHHPESLIQAFALDDKQIPADFICPITKRIMHDPAYLLSNPKINYEYTALMTWIIQNHTDPSTRAGISSPGIINNGELRKRIRGFVMDMVMERNVEHFFEVVQEARQVQENSLASSNSRVVKTDVGVQYELSSSAVSFFGRSAGTLSTLEAETQADKKSIPVFRLFESAKLGSDFYSLAAKALRRLVSENKIEEVSQLLAQFGSENIINLQDDNPASRKTALHIAVAKEHSIMAKFLVDHGARLDIEDASHETARSLSQRSSNIRLS